MMFKFSVFIKKDCFLQFFRDIIIFIVREIKETVFCKNSDHFTIAVINDTALLLRKIVYRKINRKIKHKKENYRK